ncbi:hypothetical protein AAVH_04193 [Aphelenchoides avenae]|nr:hypothetical protein AAVH_04193 [Aphelenchus avenae]
MMNNNLESALKQRRMQHFQRGNEVVEVHPMDVTGNNELGSQPDNTDNDDMPSYARAEDDHPHPFGNLRSPVPLVYNSFYYQPPIQRLENERPQVTPQPRQNARPRSYPLANLLRGGDDDRRSIDPMYSKEGLEKRRRLKERKKNSANIIDPTTLPGYFGDTDDLNKLLECVEGQPVVDAQPTKPKKSGKKKSARRKSQDVSSDVKMNGEDLEVEVALDNGDTGSETTLKDKQSASSEEGSPAHTRKNSKSSMDGKKKRKTGDHSSVTMNGNSAEGSPNENGASVSKKDFSAYTTGASKNGFVLRERGQKETVANGHVSNVPPMVTKILASAKDHSVKNGRNSSLKRQLDSSTHRQERRSQQFLFMSQLWNQFSEGREDDKTYVAASKRQ